MDEKRPLFIGGAPTNLDFLSQLWCVYTRIEPEIFQIPDPLEIRGTQNYNNDSGFL